MKIREKMCSWVGHKFDEIDEAMILIKDVAINRDAFLKDKIICKRCKKEFILKPRANQLIQKDMDTLKIVFFIALALFIGLGISMFKYEDCKKVGHSTTYCVLNFGS
jgi:hypothetical protein